MDVMDPEIEAYSEDVIAMAEKMRNAVAGCNARDLFLASALLMSWALVPQSDAIRASAVNTALDMIKRGHDLFGKKWPKIH